MNKYYSMLMQFTNGTQPCKKHLLRKYSEELIDNALKEGLIVQAGENDIGDPQYRITEKGKRLRDN